MVRRPPCEQHCLWCALLQAAGIGAPVAGGGWQLRFGPRDEQLAAGVWAGLVMSSASRIREHLCVAAVHSARRLGGGHGSFSGCQWPCMTLSAVPKRRLHCLQQYFECCFRSVYTAEDAGVNPRESNLHARSIEVNLQRSTFSWHIGSHGHGNARARGGRAAARASQRSKLQVQTPADPAGGPRTPAGPAGGDGACTSRRTRGGRGSRQRRRQPPGARQQGSSQRAARAPPCMPQPPARPSVLSSVLCLWQRTAADGRAGSFLHHVLSTVLALAKQLQAAAGCTRNASQHGAAHRSQHPGGGCHWLSMAGAQLESLVTFHFPEHKIGGAGPCIPPAQPAAASAHALCLLNRDGSYIAAATTDGGCRPH